MGLMCSAGSTYSSAVLPLDLVVTFNLFYSETMAILDDGTITQDQSNALDAKGFQLIVQELESSQKHASVERSSRWCKPDKHVEKRGIGTLLLQSPVLRLRIHVFCAKDALHSWRFIDFRN